MEGSWKIDLERGCKYHRRPPDNEFVGLKAPNIVVMVDGNWC